MDEKLGVRRKKSPRYRKTSMKKKDKLAREPVQQDLIVQVRFKFNYFIPKVTPMSKSSFNTRNKKTIISQLPLRRNKIQNYFLSDGLQDKTNKAAEQVQKEDHTHLPPSQEYFRRTFGEAIINQGSQQKHHNLNLMLFNSTSVLNRGFNCLKLVSETSVLN